MPGKILVHAQPRCCIMNNTQTLKIKNKMTLKLSCLSLITFVFSFSYGQTKLKDLKIDTTITGFHFAADFQGTIIFTKNGASAIQTINPSAFSFTIAPNLTATAAKEQLEMLLNMSKENGYKISDMVTKDTMLNGNSAYYISYVETDDKNSYKNIVFNSFVIKDETLILFVSGDLDNGKYADKFKKSFYSITL
jgi:hypothetical protein